MTLHESFDSWSIPTGQLTGPRKTGGRNSIGGFAFQEAYACLYLARLLDPQRQVVAVRYEGAQDVDLFYADGREKYLQLKNEPGARYTLTKLRPVLQGFASDLLESEGKGVLGFELVARSNDTDVAVKRLCDGTPSEEDLSAIAALLPESVKGSPAPELLRGLSERELRDLAERLLRRTTFLFGMGDEMDGRLSFQNHACVELAKHGVAGSDLLDAFEALRAALKPQRTFTHGDVQDILKRFIGGAAIELFEGRVEALTDELLSKPASPEDIMLFYKGEALLDWPVIAGNGDIRRDQQDSLVAQLSAPSEGLRLVCLVAEPGAGKSTLARRIAAELHRHHGAFVVRVRAKEDADIWYRVSDFCQKVARHFYILVDDLFRFPEVVAALSELDAGLPITILATSRTNEYQSPRIKGEVIAESLKGPSSDEKERILKRLGKSRAEMTPEQQARLDTASQFLVLMMETTEGKELRRIVEDILQWLRVHDESAYLAYEYISFSYQYNVSIPESLLTRLDNRGRFYKLPERASTRGLVFYDEDGLGKIRASHPVFAATAATAKDHYGSRDPAVVLQEIVNMTDHSEQRERRFTAHLLRVMAQTKSPALSMALSRVEASLANLLRHATVSELTIWRNVYKALGRDDLAEGCVDRALALKPSSPSCCHRLLSLVRGSGREREALPLIVEWIKSNPDSYAGLQAYLSIVEHYGTNEEKAAAIEEFSKWLARHPDDAHVRTSFISLVKQCGSRAQYMQLIRETDEWMTKHPDDNYVRTAYLEMVGQRGSEEQVGRVIQQTSEWLALHPGDTNVRVKYLSLVELRGNTKEAESAIPETASWLAKHPDDDHVRVAYLRLVERRGEGEQIKAVVGETTEWLRNHTWAKNVWETLLAMLIRSGQIEEVAGLAQQAISYHPHHRNIIHQYMRSLRDAGEDEIIKQAFEKLLSDFPHEGNVPMYFADWLVKHNRLPEAYALYNRTLESHPENFRLRYWYGRLLLKEERFAEAIGEFQKVIKARPEHQSAHDSLGHALSKVGELAEREGKKGYAERFFAHAEREFRRAIDYTEMEQIAAMFYNHLGWFYIARGRYAEAVTAFKSAIARDIDFFDRYWGLGQALFYLEQFREAEESLLTALEKLPEDPQPSVREDILELLQQCREALRQSADELKD